MWLKGRIAELGGFKSMLLYTQGKEKNWIFSQIDMWLI